MIPAFLVESYLFFGFSIVLADDFGPIYDDAVSIGLVCDGAGDQSLPRPWRPIQKHTPRRLQT